MRLRPSSLRLRTTLLSTVLVAVVLLLSLLVLTIGVRATLISNAVDAATVRAVELAQLAMDGALPSVVIAADEDEEETFVQVVIDGTVVAASESIDGEQAIPLPAVAAGETRVVNVDDLPIGDDEPFELVSHGFAAPGGGVVHVGVSIETIEEFVDILERAGLAGVPLISLALAAVLWRVTGRTLRPIEEVRRRAASIGGATLADRVPVPPTDDEVARLATTLNEMLERIERSAVAQERFASDAAHELRSPLASLRAQLEAARASSSAVDWDELSGELLHETLRMQTLSEQLLSLVNLGPERVAKTARPVDLDDVLTEVVANARSTAREGLQIEVTTLDPIQLLGVPSLLTTMVRNLIDNAATYATSTVHCSLASDDEGAVLCVEDDGPGIPASDQERVFDAFVRLDESRTRNNGGAGLGLALTRDVAAAHGGTVVLDTSATLGGARLTVRLPLG